MKDMLFILNNCPGCVNLFRRIEREYSFLLDEFHGCVKHCSADQYGCDIWFDVEGVGVRFETAPRDGIEFGYDIILPVEDPSNRLNRPHSIGKILSFIEDTPPPKYQGPNWTDNRVSTPCEFKKALQRIIEFYKSPQFAEKKRQFNKWNDWYSEEFLKSVEEYYRSHS